MQHISVRSSHFGLQDVERTELSSARVRVHVEDLVDDGVEIHEPRIFSQVVLWFA